MAVINTGLKSDLQGQPSEEIARAAKSEWIAIGGEERSLTVILEARRDFVLL
jgi:hypothetical protein